MRLSFLSLLLFASQVFAVYPPLPEAVSNNAVVSVNTSKGEYLISFMGLGEGKTYKDVHNKVFALKLGDTAWQVKTSVPSSQPLSGRLASIAVAIDDKAYLFGGYTVSKDHSEISSPDNFIYRIESDTYQAIAPMPVSVDDAVALVYQNRYIYLISGWHNDGNVNLTQVYDTQSDTWQQASPFLGAPVFGHAGGIYKNQLVICDGVRVQPLADKRRTFAQENQCFSGKIDTTNPYKIDWRVIPHATGKGRYRMAAAGVDGDVVFYGGSDNPYNYDGIGYNKIPSQPTRAIWHYSLSKNAWTIKHASTATMDHRGLVKFGGKWLVVGGMNDKQQVLNNVSEIKS